MISYEGKLDKFKVSLLLGPDSLYVGALNEVTHDYYDIDITDIVLINSNINLVMLFNIITHGIQGPNKDTEVVLNLLNNKLKLFVTQNNTYCAFNHTFELIKQSSNNISVKELKKELLELKQQITYLEQKTINFRKELVKSN